MSNHHPSPLSTSLEDLLIYEAQNEHMVDGRFLYAGALMMRAAAEIMALKAKLNETQTR